MKIDVVCNTEDEVLFKNIYHNSRRNLEWIEQVPAHDGHAVIVGGGPSLKDNIELIRWRQSLGQKVFALNNTASYLLNRGIVPDFQVILDAREENWKFIGHAREHLLASQCHESVFMVAADYYAKERHPKIEVWHPKIDGIEAHLPDKRESLTLIGGGTSVGLSAMCLAYAMGYRKLHLFGYDSSHAETTHAYPQAMNAGEPVCKVTVHGKTFKTSWTMAKQAEFFPEVCDNLIDLGCIVTVDGDGLLPFMVRMSASKLTERDKYIAMWNRDEYRVVAPGEDYAQSFLKMVCPDEGKSVIDFGCGTGRAGLCFSKAGLKVTLLDFAPNCLDEGVVLPFVEHDLTEPIPITADYGYCTDVMEHIPPEQVDLVITNIMRASGRVFFAISLVPDNMGALIGEPLHLSVHDFGWWFDKFKSLGLRPELWGQSGSSAVFYVTSTT